MMALAGTEVKATGVAPEGGGSSMRVLPTRAPKDIAQHQPKEYHIEKRVSPQQSPRLLKEPI